MLLAGAWVCGWVSPAHAAWPEDISLTSMTEHDDLPVLDREVLGRSYRQLVKELGTMVSNKPITAAETLGMHGFAIDVGAAFVLTEARDRQGEPSPWTRAHADEQSAPYHTIPTFTARKGLPLSTEIGATMGWIGGSSTGVFGGFGRVAVLEGYKPLPDVALQLGWSGYVGNDELDAGVLDLGVTLGGSYPVGSLPGVNHGHISPWATFQTLRVSANATLDPEIVNDIGAIRYQNTRDTTVDAAPPIVVPQFGGGVQFVSGTAHARITLTWAPATIPTVSIGVGVTF